MSITYRRKDTLVDVNDIMAQAAACARQYGATLVGLNHLLASQLSTDDTDQESRAWVRQALFNAQITKDDLFTLLGLNGNTLSGSHDLTWSHDAREALRIAQVFMVVQRSRFQLLPETVVFGCLEVAESYQPSLLSPHSFWTELRSWAMDAMVMADLPPAARFEPGSAGKIIQDYYKAQDALVSSTPFLDKLSGDSWRLVPKRDS